MCPPLPALSLLLCVDDAGVAALPARLAGLAAELASGPAYEIVLVGHGTPDIVAPVLRAVARPGVRVLLLTRREGPEAALAAGTAFARAPRVVVATPPSRGPGAWLRRTRARFLGRMAAIGKPARA